VARSKPQITPAIHSPTQETVLNDYVRQHNIAIPAGLTRDQLAVAVGRHFELESKSVNEEEIIGVFLNLNERAAGKALGLEPPSKRPKPATTAAARTTTTRDPSIGCAKEGEQVAAKIEVAGEETSWILATVVRSYPGGSEFDVADEDDPDKRIRVKGKGKIVRLGSVGQIGTNALNKGDAVLAVFPDTTSFYRGRISKPVKNRAAGGDVFVQFEDDEDESGRIPHHRVAARHVIADPDADNGGDKKTGITSPAHN